MLEGSGVQGRGGEKGEKWEDCNSIINKIHLKKKRTQKFRMTYKRMTYKRKGEEKENTLIVESQNF